MTAIGECFKLVPNKFELILLASHRVKELVAGATPLYEPESGDKDIDIAINEISNHLLNVEEVAEDSRNRIKSQLLFKDAVAQDFDDTLVSEPLEDKAPEMVEHLNEMALEDTGDVAESDFETNEAEEVVE